MTNWDTWDEVGEKVESNSGDYFNIKEGANKFVLMSHLAPLALKWNGSKYVPAEEGDDNVSIKGLCWVLQKDDAGEYHIKEAKLPYQVVKAIKGIAQDPDWDFELPFSHPLTLNAVGAGTKEVKYTLTPSPKKFEIPADILEEFKKKPSPEEIVEKIKGSNTDSPKAPDYPAEEINPEDIPW